jgi:MinD-like ATPase involved in chromosome partitioning or flagellar assembly
MLKPQDQAEGLRRIMMPAKSCAIADLGAWLTQGKGQLLRDLADEIQDRKIHFIDLSLEQTQDLPLALLNQHEIVLKLTQTSESIKKAFGIIKLLGKSPENRVFGIIVSSQNDEAAKTLFRNLKQVSRSLSQIQLELIGFSTLSDNWVSPAVMATPPASPRIFVKDPIYTSQFAIAPT